MLSTWVAGVLAALLLGALTYLRPPQSHLWGDEGTYLAMTASLTRDGDLRFEEADLDWARSRRPGPPATVILQQTPIGITYSKPLLFPLLAAPLYGLFGEVGPVLLNFLALTLALVLAWPYLRRLGDRSQTAATLLAFIACGAVLPYLLWRMSEMLQFSLCLAGLTLAVGDLRPGPGNSGERRAPRPAAPVGGFLLGLLVSMRFANGALVAAAALAAVLYRRPRRAAALTLAALLAFGLTSALSHRLQGTANPYKAVRSSFDAETGYPAGAQGAAALERFAERPATQSLTWQPRADWSRSLYSSLYFFIGRHTGLLAYFPAALLLLLASVGRFDRLSFAMLTGPLAIALFYLVWMPENYFGGSTFVGNRYFLIALPALLLALPRAPSSRWLATTWLIGLLFGGSAVVSVARSVDLKPSSQSHAMAGAFRLLPFESTALNLDGDTRRYWSRDFVRFVDGWSKVGDKSFRLDSRRPPTELQIATAWRGSPLHLLVGPHTPGAVLEVTDWGSRRAFRLDDSVQGLVEIDPAPAWRLHRFWWQGGALYLVRSLRLAVSEPEGGPATAVARYLGRPRDLDRPPVVKVFRADLPTSAAAGGSSSLLFQIQNLGSDPWSSEDVLPVLLVVRILPRGEANPALRTRAPLPRKVDSGDVIWLRATVSWPRDAGEYLLEALLVQEPARVLGTSSRTVIARQVVAVQPE